MAQLSVDEKSRSVWHGFQRKFIIKPCQWRQATSGFYTCHFFCVCVTLLRNYILDTFWPAVFFWRPFEKHMFRHFCRWFSAFFWCIARAATICLQVLVGDYLLSVLKHNRCERQKSSEKKTQQTCHTKKKEGFLLLWSTQRTLKKKQYETISMRATPHMFV